MEQTVNTPLLAMNGINKAFTGVQVLTDVTLEAHRGEIVALLGQNGAGKSTLMKILSGVYPHGEYTGDIKINGSTVELKNLLDAENHGIVMIPQEIEVCGNLSVAETLYISELARGSVINWRSLYSRARKDLEEFGIRDVHPETLMRTLSKSQHQLILIAKAFSQAKKGDGCKVLILDEPTASLSEHESQLLFHHLEIAKTTGMLCIYISHRLKEVFDISDRYAIMRDGRMIGIFNKDEITIDEAISKLVGSKLTDLADKNRNPGDVVLDVQSLSVFSNDINKRCLVNEISFQVREGEILGVYGLLGSGKTEIAMSLYGAWKGNVEGSFKIAGKPAERYDVADSIQAGVGFLSEDRRASLMNVRSIRENMDITFMGRFKNKSRLLNHKKEISLTNSLKSVLSLKARSLEDLPSTLSGGNKQKILFARIIGSKSKIIIVDEPTVGVDINTRRDIYNILSEQAEKEHCAVLVFSSDIEEVLEVSDRILVLRDGNIVASFEQSEIAAGQVNADKVLKAAVAG